MSGNYCRDECSVKLGGEDGLAEGFSLTHSLASLRDARSATLGTHPVFLRGLFPYAASCGFGG